MGHAEATPKLVCRGTLPTHVAAMSSAFQRVRISMTCHLPGCLQVGLPPGVLNVITGTGADAGAPLR